MKSEREIMIVPGPEHQKSYPSSPPPSQEPKPSTGQPTSPPPNSNPRPKPQSPPPAKPSK